MKKSNVKVCANNCDELSYGLVLKGLRKVGELAKSLNQALKSLDGIMAEHVEVTMPKGGSRIFTVAELLNYCGCKVSASKKGKVSVSAYKAAVAALSDESGRIRMYRNVPAHVFAESAKGQSTRVYTYDAKAAKWSTVSKFMLVDCDDNKWTADVLLKVLLQAKFAEKFAERAEKSAAAWKAVKNVYTFRRAVNKGGETNKAQKADKELVCFGK